MLPREAMQAALAEWEVVAPTLLAGLHAFVDGSDRSERAGSALFFSLHLMGQMRETRAFVPLCALAMQGETIDQALGDGVTTTLPAMLARCFDGDLAPLRAVMLAESADEFVRNAAFQAWSRIVADGHLAPEAAEAELRLHFDLLGPNAPSMAWVGWQEAISTLGLAGLRELVRRAFRRKWIGRDFMDLADFEKDLAARLGEPDAEAAFERTRYTDLDDVIDMLSRWAGFNPDPPRQDSNTSRLLPDAISDRLGEFGFGTDRPGEPAHNPYRHVGRNDPRPCGSGMKFKKCCIETLA